MSFRLKYASSTSIEIIDCIKECARVHSLEIKDILEILDESSNFGGIQEWYSSERKYKPTLESLSKRELPQWYGKAKFGIMIHWGVYSVPAYHYMYPKDKGKDTNGAEWYLRRLKCPQYCKPQDKDKTTQKFHKETYGENFDYYKFAEEFTLDKWNPDEWAKLFRKSGAKYVVITAKHHDGFALWDAPNSNYWKKAKPFGPWNSVKIGPHRDIIGELAVAVRKQGLKFGVYYSLLEWYNTLLNRDSRKKTTKYVDTVVIPQLKDLVVKYKPDIIWFDGHWNKDVSYWKTLEFLTWLYEESPVKDTVVVNDRLGKGTDGIYGDFRNYTDRYLPKIIPDRKWENVMTISRGWGYNRLHKDKDFKTSKELINIMKKTFSLGGNVLMNIGPLPDGTITKQESQRLLDIGKWMKTFE